MKTYQDPTADQAIGRVVRCKNCNRILLINKGAKGNVEIQCPRCKEKITYKL